MHPQVILIYEVKNMLLWVNPLITQIGAESKARCGACPQHQTTPQLSALGGFALKAAFGRRTIAQTRMRATQEERGRGAQ
jgi:hypothetical protein